jgi:hypothetical protein
MAFVLPTFNLTANIWHYATWVGNFPTTIPTPDATTLCNLAVGRRMAGGFIEGAWMLCPAGTDIRDEQNELRNSAHGDIVEIPAGSGKYYGVLESDDAGRGFANEHRVGWLTKATPFNVLLPPMPSYPYP